VKQLKWITLSECYCTRDKWLEVSPWKKKWKQTDTKNTNLEKQTNRRKTHKDFKAEDVSWSQISHLRVVSLMFQDHFSITL
jgi:hypothetical protein